MTRHHYDPPTAYPYRNTPCKVCGKTARHEVHHTWKDKQSEAPAEREQERERNPATSPRQFPVRLCPLADSEHRESVRQYCHVFHRPGVICVARAFHRLPRARRLALLLHEAGHLLAGPRGGEDAANRAATSYSGVPIYYTDAGALGPDLEWIKPGDASRAARALGIKL